MTCLQETKTLPKASDDELTEYMTVARAFIKASGHYSSMRQEAAWAVAEYIAYQNGKTIRDH